MKRETDGVNHPKVRYRAVFAALHAEAKRSPGGISGLALAIGRNPHSFSNKLNPMCLDSEPTVADLLESIEHLQCRRTSTAIALLADCVSVPVDTLPSDGPHNVVASFLKLAKDAGNCTGQIAAALGDGRIDRHERDECGELIDALITAAVAMRAVVRG